MVAPVTHVYKKTVSQEICFEQSKKRHLIKGIAWAIVGVASATLCSFCIVHATTCAALSVCLFVWVNPVIGFVFFAAVAATPACSATIFGYGSFRAMQKSVHHLKKS